MVALKNRKRISVDTVISIVKGDDAGSLRETFGVPQRVDSINETDCAVAKIFQLSDASFKYMQRKRQHCLCVVNAVKGENR